MFECNMVNRKSVLALVITLIIALLLLTTLISASVTENFLFSENLTMSQIDHSSTIREAYTAKMSKAGADIGNINFMIEPYTYQDNVSLNVYRVVFEVALYSWTELDSVSIKLSGPVQLYMETNHQSLTPTFSRNGFEQTITVADLDPIGRGTTTFEFILRPSNNLKQFPVDITLSIHQTNQSLQLVSLKAHTTFDAKIPLADT